MTNEITTLLDQTATRLFGDLVTGSTFSAAENGVWPEQLWNALEENGLTQPLVSVENGGAGATWRDSYVIVRAAGYFSVPVPLPETIAAGYLLSQSGIQIPESPLSLISPPEYGFSLTKDDQGAWRLDGVLPRVPWGRNVGYVIFSYEDMIVSVPVEGCTINKGSNVAGEPRDNLTFSNQAVEAAPGAFSSTQIGALIRAAQMAGAAERALEEAVSYAKERVQFGRTISKFQAIQQNLAVMASETAAAGCAAEMAFQAADYGEAEFEIAAAKIRNGEAGDIVTATAHQVLGAIGFTREHHLNLTTRRIWSWRAEFGGASSWALKLGQATIDRGGKNLWSDLTARYIDIKEYTSE